MLTYLLFMLPALAFAGYAQWRVHSAFKRGSQMPASSNLSGAQAAQMILDAYGVSGVGIEQANGFMGDHYDPSAKMLRLSPDVYSGRSISALGVAAHEVGHAIQDAERYSMLVFRNTIVPLANIGSNLSFFLIFGGYLFQAMNLVLLGVLAYSLIVVFQLVNLPVEFDASRRAKEILFNRGMVTASEQKEVSRVLNAAAMTYVAATVSAILTLVYYLVQLGILGGSDD